MMTVYPCGYSVHSAQIAALMDTDPTLLLIDLRRNPSSQIAMWRRASLIEAYGDRYGWFGETLGNINYKNGGPVRLANPEPGIAHLVDLLQQGYNLLPFCGCANYRLCHRHLVIEMLQKHLPDLVIVQPDQVACPGRLKCLSIRQPWSWLICHSDILSQCQIPPKTIENRDWSTDYRGPLLIHAGKTIDGNLFSRGVLDQSYWEYRFGRAGTALYAVMPKHASDYPHGIVGQATLTTVVKISSNPWFNGPYGLVLKNASAFAPLNYPGQMKIFDVPASLLPKEYQS